jgi:hypothetical protein
MHNRTILYMIYLIAKKVYSVIINQQTVLCCDLITVRAFLSTVCCQWYTATSCIADNIAKFGCIIASVKSVAKLKYVMDMWKHWGTWGSWIKSCKSYDCGNNVMVTKTNARKFMERAYARLSESKNNSLWWNLGTPLLAAKQQSIITMEAPSILAPKKFNSHRTVDKAAMTVFWYFIWVTDVDFPPSVTTVNTNTVAHLY